MVNHGSANEREDTPHASNAVRRRAQSVINDSSIDAGSRAVIRYGLETDDPWLAELVRRVDAGEVIIDAIGFVESPLTLEKEPSAEKLEELAEILCGSDDDSGTKWAALLVLMATLENAVHPKALANTAKHLAFTRCGELNLHGMVDTQITMLENELFSS